MDPLSLIQQTVCGAIAAAGFGMLFNVSVRLVPWCAASGAAGMALRASCLALGLSLEGASFAAALGLGAAVQLFRKRADLSENALDLVGCIPMIPGSVAAKAIIGIFALATHKVANDPQTVTSILESTVHFLFTIGAIGTGLAIPGLLPRVSTSRTGAAS